MKIFRLVRCGLLAAAVTLPLVACDSQQAAEPPPEVTTTDSPAAEGTGPEEPGPDANGYSVDLPGLPVGGGTGGDTGVEQCATASWIGDPIPEGVSVVVRDVRVEPEEAFDIIGSSCGEPDGCESFTFTAQPGKCSVPVRAKGTNGNASLLLFGEPVCADGNARRCDEFAASLTGAAIPLTQPEGPTSTTTSPSEEPSEPQDDEPEEEPSQGETTTDSTG
jgi:hypothetical protein